MERGRRDVDNAGQVADRHRHGRRGDASVAELPGGAGAPARDGAIVPDRARLVAPAGDVGHGPKRQLDRRQLVGQLPIAELPHLTIAPAPEAGRG